MRRIRTPDRGQGAEAISRRVRRNPLKTRDVGWFWAPEGGAPTPEFQAQNVPCRCPIVPHDALEAVPAAPRMAPAAPGMAVTWPEVITAYPGEVTWLPTCGRPGPPDPCPRIARKAPRLPQAMIRRISCLAPKTKFCLDAHHVPNAALQRTILLSGIPG